MTYEPHFLDGIAGFPVAPPPPPPPTPGEGGPETTIIFMTPTIDDIPQYDVFATPEQKALFRYFRRRTRGINVWQRSDLSYVLDTPVTDESQFPLPAVFATSDMAITDYVFPDLTDTNVNYPWNPSDPSGPYATVTNFDLSVDTFSLPVWLVTWYPGGAEIPITQSQALDLSAAGFGDCIR